MKIPLVVALVGMAFSFALPTLAQQKDTLDLQTAQQRDLIGVDKALDAFIALGTKYQEAFNKNDADGVAACFTENAILVAPDGMFFGRQAIAKRYADVFQQWRPTSLFGFDCLYILHAIDNAVCSAGEWSSTLQSQNVPVFVRGYWSSINVREADAWKIRMLTISEKPRLATPETN